MNDLISEIWKDIIGFEGIYKISNLWNINKISGLKIGILKPQITKDGYLRIGLTKNNIRKQYFIHRLILETFIGPRPPGMECRHLNGIRTDNRLENLRWGTSQENNDDQIKHGTRLNRARGFKNGMTKLNEKQVRVIKYLLKTNYLTQKEIGEIFDVNKKTIGAIKRNKTWKYIK